VSHHERTAGCAQFECKQRLHPRGQAAENRTKSSEMCHLELHPGRVALICGAGAGKKRSAHERWFGADRIGRGQGPVGRDDVIGCRTGPS
jgi:hypothetical protein